MDVNEELRERLLEINSMKGGARRKKKTKKKTVKYCPIKRTKKKTKAKSCPVKRSKLTGRSYNPYWPIGADYNWTPDAPCGKKKRVCVYKTNKPTVVEYYNKKTGKLAGTRNIGKNKCVEYKKCPPPLPIIPHPTTLQQAEAIIGGARKCVVRRPKRRCLIKTKAGRCKKYTTASCKKMPARLRDACPGSAAMKEKMAFLRSCRKK